MMDFIKRFVKRGLLFAWGGPAILCIVWAILNGNGVIAEISVGEAIRNVWSSILLAFIAAGISVVYDCDKLPKSIASVIQAAVLYVDYLGIYLYNNWLPTKAIVFFTILFFIVFIIIWVIIYISIKHSVKKMNEKLMQ